MTNAISRPFTLFLAIAVAAVFSTVAGAQEATDTAGPRTFTDDQGRQITATVKGVREGFVELQTDPASEKTYRFPMAKLIAADKAYLKQWIKDRGVFDLRIQEKPVQKRVEAEVAEANSTGDMGSWVSEQKNVKNSWEESLYEIEIRNHAGVDLRTAKLAYEVRILRTDYFDDYGSKENSRQTPLVFKGTADIPPLASGKSVTVKTAPAYLFHRRWEEEMIVRVSSSEGTYNETRTPRFSIRHEMQGIRLSVLSGGKTIADYESEDKRVKPPDWGKAFEYNARAYWSVDR